MVASAEQTSGRSLWVWAGIPVGVAVLLLTDGLASPWPDFVLGMTAAAVVLAWLRGSAAAGWLGLTLPAGVLAAVWLATRDDIEGLYLFASVFSLVILGVAWALLATLVGLLSSRYRRRRERHPRAAEGPA